MKTFKHLSELDKNVGYLYGVTPSLGETKFGYAYKRFVEKNYKKIYQDYVNEITFIRIDNALEDQETKMVLRSKEDSRGFQYSKEGLKAVIKAEQDLDASWEQKEFEVEPFIVKELPFALTENLKELMFGLLIDDETTTPPTEVFEPKSE